MMVMTETWRFGVGCPDAIGVVHASMRVHPTHRPEHQDGNKRYCRQKMADAFHPALRVPE